ncbi:MAG: class I SAM-dependent rRNA methyltransferase [Planctomycetes bacterium]|nr:class I SAM-dependent rRNA methyltransferase [Planctomycetota bacterium]
MTPNLASLTDPPAPTDEAGLPAGRVILKPRKALPFLGRHPWVFASAIARIEGEPDDGDVVDLFSDRERFIARGVLNQRSGLRVRLYRWEEDQPLDAAFWRDRIERAIALRRRLGLLAPHAGTRLIYSEADGLSGLVADWFAGHLVLQLNSLAMASRWPLLAPILIELLSPQSVTARIEKSIAAEEGIEPQHEVALGSPPPEGVLLEEHGIQYRVDLLGGQKTGFYLDQRDNRLAAARYMEGRRVLDLFCYTGAFSLAAAKLGGAAEVIGVDSSKKAIAAAEANAELNGVANVRFSVGEGFQTMEKYQPLGQPFEAIVLDPPKFTRTRKGVRAALQAYHRLNRRAVELLTPGGVLVTCSCSGGVLREDFLEMLSGVAQKTGRDIQLLEQRGAAPDHPVSATCLETEYLKCFICRVT